MAHGTFNPNKAEREKASETEEKLVREKARLKRQKEHTWEKGIGFSKSVLFRRKDRKLIMLMFKMQLDDYFKHSKKSHWIQLECRWRNLGCKTGYDRKKDTWYPKKQER